MKDSVSADEAVLKAERRARKRRRKEAAAAATESRQGTSREESMTPPRSRPSYIDEEDVGFDESSLPPEQARKRDEEIFYESMADAAAQDAGVGYYEDLMYEREAQKRAAAFSYGGAAGLAMGMGATVNGVTMDEEEYAEYIRAGMWRRKNKDEVERLARLDKEKREREAKEAIESERRQREERERIKRLEAKKKKNSEKEERDARERYESQWRVLTTAPEPIPMKEGSDAANGATEPHPLRFTDFPWPLYPPMPLPPLSWPSSKDVTASALSTFLLVHLPRDKRKAALRQSVLAYHPDRFERHVLRVPEDKKDIRERVRELGLRVSQTLNELMRAEGSS